MDMFFVWIATCLLLTMIMGLCRVIRGPKPADRMLGVQLFGTTGVAVLLLLAQAYHQDSFRNVALVFVLLALLALIAFVEKVPPEGSDSGEIK